MKSAVTLNAPEIKQNKSKTRQYRENIIVIHKLEYISRNSLKFLVLYLELLENFVTLPLTPAMGLVIE